jgi:hypothetical protein
VLEHCQRNVTVSAVSVSVHCQRSVFSVSVLVQCESKKISGYSKCQCQCTCSCSVISVFPQQGVSLFVELIHVYLYQTADSRQQTADGGQAAPVRGCS